MFLIIKIDNRLSRTGEKNVMAMQEREDGYGVVTDMRLKVSEDHVCLSLCL